MVMRRWEVTLACSSASQYYDSVDSFVAWGYQPGKRGRLEGRRVLFLNMTWTSQSNALVLLSWPS